MTVVSVPRYRAITNDYVTPSARIEEALTDAVERLEERLDRPLAAAERESGRAAYDPRTDRWRITPRATPLASVDSTWWTIEGDQLVSWSPTIGAETVTYVGGWVERADNPEAPNRLPLCIEEDLAVAAWTLLHPPGVEASQVPAGATSVRLGDLAIGYTNGTPGVNRSGIRWSRRTLAYRYRPVVGTQYRQESMP
jgi:hypothetical protein